ncbi:hypothetical protein MNBD_GAMMA10-959 [hydrothermal vent metagenome]|uniref:Type II secretion system protein GspF domain-containing protein n=1 Tax=hydrothermal vent metagenome TaxID=652676 RepID=A0A3B0XZJ3_9ZZZZ
MSWDRFHYLCRTCSQRNTAETDFSDVLSTAEAQKSIELYGEQIIKKSVSDEILSALKQSKDTALIDKSMLVYAHVNFAKSIDEPAKFKRVVVYLWFLAAVYIYMSSIHALFVMPGFLSMFENTDVAVPSLFMWYVNYSSYLTGIIVVALLLILFISYQLRAISGYKLPGLSGVYYRWLMPAGIKKSFSSIIEIITYPVMDLIEDKYQKAGVISAHLADAEKSGLNLAVEIESLLRVEAFVLNKKIERFMIAMMSVVSVIIVGSIVLFLMSAYSPLFIMGEGL